MSLERENAARSGFGTNVSSTSIRFDQPPRETASSLASPRCRENVIYFGRQWLEDRARSKETPRIYSALRLALGKTAVSFHTIPSRKFGNDRADDSWSTRYTPCGLLSPQTKTRLLYLPSNSKRRLLRAIAPATIFLPYPVCLMPELASRGPHSSPHAICDTRLRFAAESDNINVQGKPLLPRAVTSGSPVRVDRVNARPCGRSRTPANGHGARRVPADTTASDEAGALESPCFEQDLIDFTPSSCGSAGNAEDYKSVRFIHSADCRSEAAPRNVSKFPAAQGAAWHGRGMGSRTNVIVPSVTTTAVALQPGGSIYMN